MYYKFIYNLLNNFVNHMINIKQNKVIITSIVAVILFDSFTNQIFGHTFAGDESASFLALMDQMQTEMNLINTNLITNNQSLAKDHLNKITSELYTEEIKKEIAERNERIANEISSIIDEISITIEEKTNQDISDLAKTFNDVLQESVSVRIESDAMTNSTIQALHFSNLIDAIDLAYATAVGTKPMNMSAMSMSMNDSNSSMSDIKNNRGDMLSSNMNMIDSMSNSLSSSMTNMSKDIDNNSKTTETTITTNKTNNTITNIASYQTAKGLTKDAIDLFNSTIKQNIPSNATENTNAIQSGLQ